MARCTVKTVMCGDPSEEGCWRALLGLNPDGLLLVSQAYARPSNGPGSPLGLGFLVGPFGTCQHGADSV